LDGVGTPLGVTGGGGFGADLCGLVFDLGAPGCLRLLPAVPRPASPDASPFPLPLPLPPVVVVFWVVVVGVVVVEFLDVVDEPCDGFGWGVVAVEVEVEVELVVGVVEVVTVTAGVVAVIGGHDWLTLVIGRVTGSGSDVGSVPGGTFWNVNCWPPATVIVTVHPSAEALGIEARPSTATAAPTAKATSLKLRLFNTMAYSSRKVPPRAKSLQQ
jgi:hypothetical protein